MNFFGLLNKQSSTDLVGLYLKPNGIGYAQVRKNSDQKLDILACEFLDFEQPDQQQEALEQIVNSCNAKGANCIAALSPQYVNIIHLETPKVENDELVSAIRWQLRDKIDFDPQLAAIAFINMPGARQEVSTYINAIAVNQQIIKEKIALIKPSGLNLSKIDITELAIKNFALSINQDSGSGLAIIHLFLGQGVLQIIHNNQLYMTRRLGVGRDSFKIDPMNEMDPERQKKRVMDKLVLEIQRSLDYYESHFKNPPIQSVALPPLEGKIPEFASYISTQLALHAWTIDLNSQFTCHTDIDEPTQIECIPAIGTALSAFEGDAT